MDKLEKPTSVSNTENTSKKYKFYRKPSFKKAPEVRQTKTSLARLLKANPLLKYDQKAKNAAPNNDSNAVNLEVPKISITHVSGKSKPNDISRCRLSSSDFNRPLLSSTLTEIDDNIFVKPEILPKTEKTEKKVPNILNSKTNFNRRTLSGKHFDKKKKELNELSRRSQINNKALPRGIESLRRSISLESFSKKACYRIEEEETTDAHLSESQSMKDLSQSKKEFEPAPQSSTGHASDLPPVGELQERIDDWLINYTQNKPLNNGSFDDEDKENIEVEILETDSYEDLKINQDDDINKNKKNDEVCQSKDVKNMTGEVTRQDTKQVSNVLKEWSREELIRVHNEYIKEDLKKAVHPQLNKELKTVQSVDLLEKAKIGDCNVNVLDEWSKELMQVQNNEDTRKAVQAHQSEDLKIIESIDIIENSTKSNYDRRKSMGVVLEKMSGNIDDIPTSPYNLRSRKSLI